MKAATTAFSATHAIEDYHAAKTCAKLPGAGKSWTSLREALIEDLIAAPYAHDRVAILIEEGLTGDAVKAAGKKGERAGGDETLFRLVDLAAASHPDWAIGVATTRALSIIEHNRSGHYAEAALWLERASHAYSAADREEEWTRLLEGLIETHRRKYKLRLLLEALR